MSLAIKNADSCPSFTVSSKMGRWLSTCKPKEGFAETEIFGAFFLVIGTLMMLFPIVKDLKTQQGLAIVISFAVIALLIGTGLLLYSFIAKKHIVHLYEGGLVREINGKTFEFAWQDIKHVWLHESSFNVGTLSVTVDGPAKEKLVFNTEYQGDADQIVHFLKDKVADVEYKFME